MDSPGMRELGTAFMEQGIEEVFEELDELTTNCRFADCTHTGEPGCALLAALEQGLISPERYNNFMKMQRESDFFQRSYQEKRSRDKQFGKMIKSIMKDHVKAPR